jgi:glutaredoxin
VTLTLYIRRGCHLCDDMKFTLDELAPDYAFSLQVVDIDTDPELQQRYNVLVPVLCHDQLEICHHFLDLEQLKKVLNRRQIART